jgi:hypothetical protein
MEQSHSNKEHEFFYICGHGSIILDENNNATEYKMPNSVIYTFAPPGATCSLPPETIEQLREKLVETRTTYTNSEKFWKQVLKAEREIRGINYCSEEWVHYFAKQHGYSPTKACNKQINTILQKSYTFYDVEHNLPFGIWNLTTNTNYLKYLGEEHHDLYSICTFLKHLFPDKVINILDITCNSPLLFDESGYDESARMQRRLSRSSVIAELSDSHDKPKKRNTTNKRPIGKIRKNSKSRNKLRVKSKSRNIASKSRSRSRNSRSNSRSIVINNSPK